MILAELFGIKRGDVVCVTGAGGKTSLIKRLAAELACGHRLLVSTTTRMAADEMDMPCDTLVHIDGEKALAPDMDALAAKVREYDITLLESDGAARKRLKGWADHEPVIPEYATLTIGVLDTGTLGAEADKSIVHRPEQFTKLTGVAMGGQITLQALAEIVRSPEGLFKNAAHTRKAVYCRGTGGKELSRMLDVPVVQAEPRLASVIMAAGSSRRMGENKLMMRLGEKAVLERFLDEYPADLFYKTAFVCSDDEVAETAERYNLNVLRTPKGDEKCETIKLGTKECLGADGIMFFVADQPFLQRRTVEKLSETFASDITKIVIPVCREKQRNPVIFPESTHKGLLDITGDKGGRDVIDRNAHLRVFAEIDDEAEFLDIDTREDFRNAEEKLG